MKMTPKLDRASKLMQPGRLSKDGFFGNEERDLPTLINDQHAQCLKLGVSYKTIGEAMEKIGRRGLAAFGCTFNLENRFEVIADENRGKIPCPFPHPGVYQKTIYTVKNIRTGKSVRYSELSIHMIREHGFFQGPEAPFYNSPETLVEVLEIEKE